MQKKEVSVGEALEITVPSKLEIQGNFEEVKQLVQSRLEKFRGLKLDKKNVAQFEFVVKEVRDARIVFENKRKAIQAQFIDLPVNKFKADMKEIVTYITEIEDGLKDQLKEYDQIRIENLRLIFIEYIDNISEEYELTQEYKNAILLEQRYFNKTAKEKDVYKAIEAQAQAQKKLQDAYTADVNMINITCKGTDLNPDVFIKKLEWQSSSIILQEILLEKERMTEVAKRKEEELREKIAREEAAKEVAEEVEVAKEEPEPIITRVGIPPSDSVAKREIDKVVSIDEVAVDTRTVEIKYRKEDAKRIQEFFKTVMLEYKFVSNK